MGMMEGDPMAFKEWQVVCDALARGRQTVLFRKGGIREGRDGFSFAHQQFFLFPTRFHATTGQITEGEVETLPEWRVGDAIGISHFVRAHKALTLSDWSAVQSLSPLHIYSEDTLRDRFYWQGRNMAAGSIHVAWVEVIRLSKPWVLSYTQAFGGCRSWIKLPAVPKNVFADACAVDVPRELQEIAEEFFS